MTDISSTQIPIRYRIIADSTGFRVRDMFTGKTIFGSWTPSRSVALRFAQKYNDHYKQSLLSGASK